MQSTASIKTSTLKNTAVVTGCTHSCSKSGSLYQPMIQDGFSCRLRGLRFCFLCKMQMELWTVRHDCDDITSCTSLQDK